MRLTPSMRRCLALLDQNGEALRVWHGSRAHEWSWHIGEIPMGQPIDRCIQAGLLNQASRDRLVLSPLGQRVVRGG